VISESFGLNTNISLLNEHFNNNNIAKYNPSLSSTAPTTYLLKPFIIKTEQIKETVPSFIPSKINEIQPNHLLEWLVECSLDGCSKFQYHDSLYYIL
jgi:hypothetical protein